MSDPSTPPAAAPRSTFRNWDLVIALGFRAGWFLLQLWALPSMGVKT